MYWLLDLKSLSKENGAVITLNIYYIFTIPYFGPHQYANISSNFIQDANV